MYSSLAFVFLGIIVGLAFVADGWRSHPDQESAGLFKSPKIRGILYIIGGTFISAIQPLLNVLGPNVAVANIGGPVYTYLLGCTITILLSLLFLTVLVFFVSKIKAVEPHASKLRLATEAFSYSLTALHDGYQKYLTQIDDSLGRSYSKKIKRIEIQRDATFQFFGGYFASLIVNVSNKKTGADNFITLLENYSLELRRRLLLPSPTWRVGVYYFDSERQQFLYLLGSSPLNGPHSRKPIPYEGSLARYAHDHPYTPHDYIDKKRPKKSKNDLVIYKDDPDNRETALFHRRQAKNWYQTIIVCSIKNLRPPELDLPELILCLDCVDDISDSEDFAFIRTVALLVALAFADAVLGMGISNRELVTSKLNQQVKPENDYD